MTETEIDSIGYYGRPITELSREELLEAFAAATSILSKYRKILGSERAASEEQEVSPPLRGEAQIS